MVDRPTVLILTSETGSGHLSLAEALRSQLEHDFAINIEDLLPATFRRHYRALGRHALWLWSAEFRLTDGARRAMQVHRMLDPLIAHHLDALMARLAPDAVVTTHPLLSYAVMRRLQRHFPAVPFVALFSDAVRVHATWLSAHQSAATLVPTDETHQQALAAGFPRERLHRVSWPLRSQFHCAERPARDAAIADLNRRYAWTLDPERFTVFLQGGGGGATSLMRTLKSVLNASKNVQVILATGTNTYLRQRVRGLDRLHALPFTPEIAPFMSVADVVAGKAGPNALFEAIALGRPFIATSYMPGQEVNNLAFIRRHGLGWVALRRAHLRELIAQLVADYATARVQLNSTTARLDAFWRRDRAVSEPVGPLVRSLLRHADSGHG